VLEDHPDALAEAPQAVGIQRGDVLAIDPDAPARGFLQARLIRRSRVLLPAPE